MDCNKILTAFEIFAFNSIDDDSKYDNLHIFYSDETIIGFLTKCFVSIYRYYIFVQWISTPSHICRD